MIVREAQKTLLEMAAGFPAVAITGPRQCGKTTLAKMAFPNKPYVSFEDPDFRQSANGDPRGFLDRYPDGAILDEIQNAPQLVSYLQGVLDAAPDRMGRFVLTGSRQFALMEKVTQSLAGRIGILSLAPFTWRECYGDGLSGVGFDEMIFRGLFPPVHERKVEPRFWYSGYVQSYLERDVRQQLNVQNLDAFQRFLRLAAGRTGQMLNVSSLANDVGIASNTARSWLSILEAAGLVFLLPPYQVNVNKRLVKTPKLYFCDAGLACWLLGVESAAQLAPHPLYGALAETAIVVELMKGPQNMARQPRLYYWRDSSGLEIDVIHETAAGLVPTEIKAGKTYQPEWSRPMRQWAHILGPRALPGRVVYGGDIALSDNGIEATPWRCLSAAQERKERP